MRVTTLREQERTVLARRAALGLSGDDSRIANSGLFRTADKRALLESLSAALKSRGRSTRFTGKF
jgi:hypothetical protein